MEKPTVSLYDLGAGLGVVAGLEYADQITRPVEGAHFRISGFLDGPDTDQVKSYMRDLDVSIESFKNDASKNVPRDTFLQSLNQWLFGWKQFVATHSSTTQILLAGRDNTMNQAREYQKQLEGWRDAYARETGKNPEGQVPTKPPEASSGMPLSTKLLIGLAAIGTLGFVGYATYRYVKKAREDLSRAENFARGFAEKSILGGGHSGGADVA